MNRQPIEIIEWSESFVEFAYRYQWEQYGNVTILESNNDATFSQQQHNSNQRWHFYSCDQSDCSGNSVVTMSEIICLIVC